MGLDPSGLAGNCPVASLKLVPGFTLTKVETTNAQSESQIINVFCECDVTHFIAMSTWCVCQVFILAGTRHFNLLLLIPLNYSFTWFNSIAASSTTVCSFRQGGGDAGFVKGSGLCILIKTISRIQMLGTECQDMEPYTMHFIWTKWLEGLVKNEINFFGLKDIWLFVLSPFQSSEKYSRLLSFIFQVGKYQCQCWV